MSSGSTKPLAALSCCLNILLGLLVCDERVQVLCIHEAVGSRVMSSIKLSRMGIWHRQQNSSGMHSSCSASPTSRRVKSHAPHCSTSLQRCTELAAHCQHHISTACHSPSGCCGLHGSQSRTGLTQEDGRVGDNPSQLTWFELLLQEGLCQREHLLQDGHRRHFRPHQGAGG